MTEPLFLALLIWIALLTVECVAAIRAARHAVVARRLIVVSIFILAAVYTRYDGWVLGATVWCVLTFTLAQHRDVWRRVAPSFVFFTLLVIAGPISWLAYNHHFFHDPLDFIRGPSSASAIEKKTAAPGLEQYHGWHNPFWAFVYYTRTAQVDAAFWETGFLVMAAASGGLGLAIWRPPALLAAFLLAAVAVFILPLPH